MFTCELKDAIHSCFGFIDFHLLVSFFPAFILHLFRKVIFYFYASGGNFNVSLKLLTLRLIDKTCRTALKMFTDI